MHAQPTGAAHDPAEVKVAILRALRHGPLDEFLVAAGVAVAPFLVRALLALLEREHRVCRTGDGRWELTARGQLGSWFSRPDGPRRAPAAASRRSSSASEGAAANGVRADLPDEHLPHTTDVPDPPTQEAPDQ